MPPVDLNIQFLLRKTIGCFQLVRISLDNVESAQDRTHNYPFLYKFTFLLNKNKAY